jgi:hypothetical protein
MLALHPTEGTMETIGVLFFVAMLAAVMLMVYVNILRNSDR